MRMIDSADYIDRTDNPPEGKESIANAFTGAMDAIVKLVEQKFPGKSC